MNQWQVSFETHSRNDVMKICSLLAKGIGEDTVLSRKVLVQIAGFQRCGKSAIVDGLTAAFTKKEKSYKLPKKTLVEGSEGLAISRTVYKVFNYNGKRLPVFLRNKGTLDFHEEYGLGFQTFFNLRSNQASMYISFDIDRGGDYRDTYNNIDSWHRFWFLNVEDTVLQTSEMSEVLEHIRDFHACRQARLNGNSVLLEAV